MGRGSRTEASDRLCCHADKDSQEGMAGMGLITALQQECIEIPDLTPVVHSLHTECAK